MQDQRLWWQGVGESTFVSFSPNLEAEQEFGPGHEPELSRWSRWELCHLGSSQHTLRGLLVVSLLSPSPGGKGPGLQEDVNSSEREKGG